MKILCILILHNAEQILPFTFRHYDQFVDEYWVFDDRSTDGTQAILKANPKVKQREFTGMEGLYEEQNLGLIYQTYPEAVGKFDWVMCPDPDEFLYAPMMRKGLGVAQHAGFELVRSKGYNLVGDGFPKDDGHSQIYELNPMGVNAPIYSKPIVFQPHVRVRWMRGRHQIEDCNPVMTLTPHIKLLHARYFGSEHTRQRNAKAYDRCGFLNNDKGPAWSCSTGYDAPHLEGSPQWAEFARTQAFNVLEAPL